MNKQEKAQALIGQIELRKSEGWSIESWLSPAFAQITLKSGETIVFDSETITLTNELARRVYGILDSQ